MDEEAYWDEEATITEGLPEGYFIIDGEIQEHDCDVEDGRYCLYGPSEDFEPLGNLHDLDELIKIAHAHANGEF